MKHRPIMPFIAIIVLVGSLLFQSWPLIVGLVFGYFLGWRLGIEAVSVAFNVPEHVLFIQISRWRKRASVKGGEW